MEFEYEISADDYASAAILFYKLSRKRLYSMGWVLSGTFLLVVGLTEKDRGLSAILLGAIGIWWICAGLARLFPGDGYRRQCRKYYQKLGLAGQKYQATVDGGGFEVVGEHGSWRNPWPLVSLKGEDKQVFMFYSCSTLFIFAKRYLSEAQQLELRALASLPHLAVFSAASD